jgi:hypothetical protein
MAYFHNIPASGKLPSVKLPAQIYKITALCPYVILLNITG